MARVYATAAEFYAFTGGVQPTETPEGETDPVPVVELDLDAELARASRKVDRDTRLAVYAFDEDKMPTDPEVIEAFRDATCAYVAWFRETGDITGAESQGGSVKIGSVSLGNSAAEGTSAEDARRSPEAIDILTTAGLRTAFPDHN